ncbi:hypothetical protein EK21DRAFT_75330 [Setomelanomma holmii]|uniref:Zn(2)-C6 fungal-type domain-containing protein n=1 Tax=Setomelanomma holmii TaxID=210430 RepID=A0A9P4H1Z6_9PLEO|nr:hypothetical protein EK21DRAFT_75330 [Setomelanomma holmii]
MSTSPDPSSRPMFACIRCAERKVRCDRQRPCSACTKHNKECIFSPTKQPRKRNRRIKVQSLVDQLGHYESLLQKNGIVPTVVVNTTATDIADRTSQNHASDAVRAQVKEAVSFEIQSNQCSGEAAPTRGNAPFTYRSVASVTRVSSGGFLTAKQSHDPDKSAEFSDTSSDDSDSGQGFVLSSGFKSSKRPRHPSPGTMHKLWEVFVENVDPLTKIVHVPTLRPAVHRAMNDTTGLPRSFEALLFAIYGVAIMSIQDDECQKHFSEDRRHLLSRYTSLAGRALSRARLMETTNLVVLQALLLHLLSVRDIYAPRAVWQANPNAWLRIAQTMGLERDGNLLGLSPFETELRRRIWWQLKLHDFRTAELCGLAKFRDLDLGPESPRWPTNINDDQLHPGMTAINGESGKVTDVVFVAFRCEMTNFAASCVAEFRKQGKDPSMWALHNQDQAEKARAFEKLQDTLETKYLRYCDPSRPLHLLTMLVGRYGMNVVKFLTNHPRKWISLEQTPLEERKLVWDVSIQLLEQHDMVQSNPMLRSFAWHAAYFQQWHAFIHVLDILRADPLHADATKAWKLISNTYENTPEMFLNMKKPLHIAVAKLCLRAYDARETAVRNAKLYSEATPAFIVRLRHQREASKAKHQAQVTKSKQNSETVKHNQGIIHIEPHSALVSGHNSDIPTYDFTQQNYPEAVHDMDQITFDAQNDPFGFFTDFNVTHMDDETKNFGFGTDQDRFMNDLDMRDIDWEQWDAWLAESNVMRPCPT